MRGVRHLPGRFLLGDVHVPVFGIAGAEIDGGWLGVIESCPLPNYSRANDTPITPSELIRARGISIGAAGGMLRGRRARHAAARSITRPALLLA